MKVMKSNRLPAKVFLLNLFLAALITGLLPRPFPSALADESKAAPLDRGISVAPQYTGVIVPAGRDVSMDLTLENRGAGSESVLVSFPRTPEGWKIRVKTYAFEVTGAHVPAQEARTLTLAIEPEGDVEPGEYVFPIEARSEDNSLTASARLMIRVATSEEVCEADGVVLSTSYPVLEGPTDAGFEFSVDLENRLNTDSTYSLKAEGPKNWGLRFKPAYEDKYISSLHIKAGQSRSVGVEVRPGQGADPGRYPIRVEVGSDRARAQAEFVVVLTGTHKISAGTAEGLLSLDADQGKTARLSLYVENNGSAVQRDIRFLSFKPENWEVTFEPESIDILDPGDVRQVELFVTPADRALVGDYSVSVSVQGERVSRGLELRVTVKASTAWGWIGVGVILFVIAGLATLFIRLGRR